MAEEACHGFGSTTQVGLTQALGLMPSTRVRCRHCKKPFDLSLLKMTGFPAWIPETTFCPHCSRANISSIFAAMLSQFVGSIAAITLMVFATSNFDLALFPKILFALFLIALLVTMFGSMYAVLYMYYKFCDQPFM